MLIVREKIARGGSSWLNYSTVEYMYPITRSTPGLTTALRCRLSAVGRFLLLYRVEKFYKRPSNSRIMSSSDSKKLELVPPVDKKSYAGIPEANFVDDVDAFMAKPANGGSSEKVLKELDENHSKYKFMEYNLVNKRRRLKSQLPDLEYSLEMIKKLQVEKNNSHDLQTQFMLSDQVYAKAVVAPTDKVCLWLGANVMLEYTLDDAQELLTKNIEELKKNLAYIEHDLDFVRDQFTTTEVNMARVYNWDVKRRQAERAET